MSNKNESLKKSDIDLTRGQKKTLVKFLSLSDDKAADFFSNIELFMTYINSEKWILVPHEKGNNFKGNKYIFIPPDKPSKKANLNIKSCNYSLTQDQKNKLAILLSLSNDKADVFFQVIESYLSDNLSPDGNLAKPRTKETRDHLNKIAQGIWKLEGLVNELDESVCADLGISFNVNLENLMGFHKHFKNKNRSYSTDSFPKKVHMSDALSIMRESVDSCVRSMKSKKHTSKPLEKNVESLYMAWWVCDIGDISFSTSSKFINYLGIILYPDDFKGDDRNKFKDIAPKRLDTLRKTVSKQDWIKRKKSWQKIFDAHNQK